MFVMGTASELRALLKGLVKILEKYGNNVHVQVVKGTC